MTLVVIPPRRDRKNTSFGFIPIKIPTGPVSFTQSNFIAHRKDMKSAHFVWLLTALVLFSGGGTLSQKVGLSARNC